MEGRDMATPERTEKRTDRSTTGRPWLVALLIALAIIAAIVLLTVAGGGGGTGGGGGGGIY